MTNKGEEASNLNFNGGFCRKKRKKTLSSSSSSSTSSSSASLKFCGFARSSNSRGQWTDEEDSLLVELVKEYGLRKWSLIAKKFVGRIGKQCRERWHNHLRPDIKKDAWTEGEERLLIEGHERNGNKWAEIAKLVPGRSENSIKNYWNATQRRLASSTRKLNRRSRAKPPSLLQSYITTRGLFAGGDRAPPVAEEPSEPLELGFPPKFDDMCLTYLLDGAAMEPLLEGTLFYEQRLMEEDRMLDDDRHYFWKKDVDLVEMISSFSPSSSASHDDFCSI